MNIKDYNWDLWLPPKELPDTGNKILIPGQIWAWAYDQSGAVVLVSMNPHGAHRALASFGSLGCLNGLKISYMSPSDRARHAVLVADVDKEPADPDLLYQFLYK